MQKLQNNLHVDTKHENRMYMALLAMTALYMIVDNNHNNKLWQYLIATIYLFLSVTA